MIEQDAKIYALFSGDGKITLTEINAVTDNTIKACLTLLYNKGGFIYSGDFRESGKKRRVRREDDHLVAAEEIIVKDTDANNK